MLLRVMNKPGIVIKIGKEHNGGFMTQFHPKTALISLAMSIFFIAAGCGEKQSEEKDIIRPVRYQIASLGQLEKVRTFSGAAKSALESRLSFKVHGTLKKIQIKVGDRVKRGDFIAILDDKDYRLQVQEAEAGLAQTRAKEMNASSSYGRVKKLYENDNVSKSDLDRARAAYDSAKAAVRSIRKKLELAKLQLSYTTLKAPFEGAVSMVNADENENIAAGHPVVILASNQGIDVSVAIPELLISSIREGAIVSVSFSAFPNKIFQGQVTEVGVATSGFATTYPVTVSLTENSRIVKPGMVAEVRFVFDTHAKPAIVVPSHAVSEDDSGRFVYLVVPSKEKGVGIVRKTPVTVNELVAGGLEITSGIVQGDLVVTAGISRLYEGRVVRLLSGEQQE